jgi:superfamily I DNA/RNA helicase
MPNRIIIPGPPGTGKTHRLMRYLNVELKRRKTDPTKIAYISFSKAAKEEAERRVENKKVNVCTMHSLGARTLNLDTGKYLLKDSKWNGFKNFSRICRDLTFESYINESGYPQYKNSHMKIIEYARSKKMEIYDAAIDLGIHYDVNLNLTRQIKNDLESYKEQTGMFEFSDMIVKFIENKKCPPLEAVFLDEAQDLSPLQWDMFFYIESNCERSYIAGDDDQTIYTFQGADPKIFINLKGKFDPQIKSRRVPKSVHSLAVSIFPHMSERLNKEWRPRDAEGSVQYNARIEDINFYQDNWMILARTNKMLTPIANYLYSLNVRFDSKGNSLLPKKLLSAYRAWIRLNQGAFIDRDEAKAIYDYLSSQKGQVKHGFSSGKSLEHIKTIDLDTLCSEHGLRVTGSWEQLNIPEDSKNYIKALLESGDDLMQKARIKISTIHSVKGEECDNVVLYTDLEQIIYDSALKKADPEHRTFFVGITRTKENLYLTSAGSDHQYNIGAPII